MKAQSKNLNLNSYMHHLNGLCTELTNHKATLMRDFITRLAEFALYTVPMPDWIESIATYYKKDTVIVQSKIRSAYAIIQVSADGTCIRISVVRLAEERYINLIDALAIAARFEFVSAESAIAHLKNCKDF